MTEEPSVPVMVRIAPDLLEKVDAWRREQPDLPSRPEAIRRLTAAKLSEAPKPKFRVRKLID